MVSSKELPNLKEKLWRLLQYYLKNYAPNFNLFDKKEGQKFLNVIEIRHNPKDKEKFRIFVIVDEAKLLVSKNQKTKAVLNKYASEIRKNGGGLILASQLISHFNNEILANIALKMCMKAEDKEQAKANDKYYGVGIDVLLNLDRGEAILIQGDFKERIKIIPSRER